MGASWVRKKTISAIRKGQTSALAPCSSAKPCHSAKSPRTMPSHKPWTGCVRHRRTAAHISTTEPARLTKSTWTESNSGSCEAPIRTAAAFSCRYRTAKVQGVAKAVVMTMSYQALKRIRRR